MIVGHVCKRIMLIVMPVEGNETVISELNSSKNQQTTKIRKGQERIHNIDINIEIHRQTTPMSNVYVY